MVLGEIRTAALGEGLMESGRCLFGGGPEGGLNHIGLKIAITFFFSNGFFFKNLFTKFILEFKLEVLFLERKEKCYMEIQIISA